MASSTLSFFSSFLQFTEAKKEQSFLLLDLPQWELYVLAIKSVPEYVQGEMKEFRQSFPQIIICHKGLVVFMQSPIFEY